MIRLPISILLSGLDLNVKRQTSGFLRCHAKDRDASGQARNFAALGLPAAEHVSPSRGRSLGCEHKVQDFSCLGQIFAMAFAQQTYRELLRDIEVNLRAQAKRLGPSLRRAWIPDQSNWRTSMSKRPIRDSSSWMLNRMNQRIIGFVSVMCNLTSPLAVEIYYRYGICQVGVVDRTA